MLIRVSLIASYWLVYGANKGEERSKAWKSKYIPMSELHGRILTIACSIQASQGENDTENKKLRRSDRISSQSQTTGASQPTKEQNLQLPTPLTKQETTLSGTSKDGTVTPPEGRPSQIEHRSPFSSPRSGANGLASPPGDTQPFSQALQNPQTFSRDVKDEASEGVWGYLIPLDNKFGDTLVLKERVACPLPKAMKKSRRQHHSKDKYEKQEEDFEDSKISGVAAGGYLIGRHPECGMNPCC